MGWAAPICLPEDYHAEAGVKVVVTGVTVHSRVAFQCYCACYCAVLRWQARHGVEMDFKAR